jgi:hypothetical protein
VSAPQRSKLKAAESALIALREQHDAQQAAAQTESAQSAQSAQSSQAAQAQLGRDLLVRAVHSYAISVRSFWLALSCAFTFAAV